MSVPRNQAAATVPNSRAAAEAERATLEGATENRDDTAGARFTASEPPYTCVRLNGSQAVFLCRVLRSRQGEALAARIASGTPTRPERTDRPAEGREITATEVPDKLAAQV